MQATSGVTARETFVVGQRVQESSKYPRDWPRPKTVSGFGVVVGFGRTARTVRVRRDGWAATTVQTYFMEYWELVPTHPVRDIAIVWRRGSVRCVLTGDGTACALTLREGERTVDTTPMPDEATALSVSRSLLRDHEDRESLQPMGSAARKRGAMGRQRR